MNMTSFNFNNIYIILFINLELKTDELSKLFDCWSFAYIYNYLVFNFNLQNLASSSLFNQELATAQIQNKDSFSQGVLSGALSEQETIQMKQEM